MFAARREHCEREIWPRMQAGEWIVCDRFTDATYAYQGGGHGLGDGRDRRARALCAGGIPTGSDADLRCARCRRPRAPGRRADTSTSSSASRSSSSSACARSTSLAPRPSRSAVALSTARNHHLPCAISLRRSSPPYDRRRRIPNPQRGSRSRLGSMRPLRACCWSATRWPHAVLIAGPQGLGKRLLALHLARALLCEAPRADGGACGTCTGCGLVERRSHPDLRLIEPITYDDEGNATPVDSITVEPIRDLIDFAFLSSHRGGAKVAIDRAGRRAQRGRANALLKTLEEPPPGTYLLLLSHRPGRLPATIVSRCRRLPVGMPDRALALGVVIAPRRCEAGTVAGTSGWRTDARAGTGRRRYPGGSRLAAWRTRAAGAIVAGGGGRPPGCHAEG